MDREDNYFTPEAIDKQIDRLLKNPQLQAPSSDTHMLNELRDLHQEDAHRLEDIWERLTEQALQRASDNKSLIDIEYYRQKNFRAELRKQTDYKTSPRKRTTVQRLGLFISELVAVLVIASIIAIPTLIGHLTASSNIMQQTRYSIYMSNSQGISSVNTKTRQVNWKYAIQDYNLVLQASPTVGNGMVYAESQDSIYAIDAVTGSLRWSHTFSSQFSPYPPSHKVEPILSGDYVYVAIVVDTGTEIDKLSATKGEIIGKYQLPLKTNALGITIKNDNLYAFGLYDICALRLSDGRQIWCTPDNPHVFATLHIADNTIYTLSTTNENWPYIDPDSTSYIQAFDINTGTPLWQSDAIHGTATDITIANGFIYCGATDGSITAYDMHNGIQHWHKILAGMSFSSTIPPLVNANTMYMNANIEYTKTGTSIKTYQPEGIIALDATNGAIKWNYPASISAMKSAGHAFGPPHVLDGVVFVNDTAHQVKGQNTLQLYALSNGKALWHSTIQQDPATN